MDNCTLSDLLALNLDFKNRNTFTPDEQVESVIHRFDFLITKIVLLDKIVFDQERIKVEKGATKISSKLYYILKILFIL